MSGGLFRLLAGAAGAVLALGATPAAADMRLCSGKAGAEYGGTFSVYVHVDDQTGEVTERTGIWTPPGLNAGAMFSGGPALLVDYAMTGPVPGKPIELTVMGAVVVSAAPATRTADMVARFDGAEVWRERWKGFDREPVRTARGFLFLDIGKPASSRPGKEVRPDLLDRFDAAKEVLMEIQAPGLPGLSPVTYRVGDHAARDALAAEAWSRAAEAVKKPKRCEKLKPKS